MAHSILQCVCLGIRLEGVYWMQRASRHRNNIVAFKSLGQLLVPGMQTCLVSEWTDSQCTGSGVSGCSAADAPARKVDGSLPTARAVRWGIARGTRVYMLFRLQSIVSANFTSVQTSNNCHHHNHIPTF